MVNAGLMPATIVDDYLATFWSQVFDHITVRDAIAVNDNGRIAWAVPKGQPAAQAGGRQLREHPGKGTLQANVVLKQISQEHRLRHGIRHPLKSSASFGRSSRFFKKYGEQYDFPWLLVAAQGYQESQLDQIEAVPRALWA